MIKCVQSSCVSRDVFSNPYSYNFEITKLVLLIVQSDNNSLMFPLRFLASEEK